jgi:hypothetical protein
MKAPAKAASPSGTRLTRVVGWPAAGSKAATRKSKVARMSRASRKGEAGMVVWLGGWGSWGGIAGGGSRLRRVGLGGCCVGFDPAGQRVELLDGGLSCGVAGADLAA